MRGIDFTLSTDSLGGAELYTLELARACSSLTDVAVLGRGGSSLLRRARELGIKTRAVDLGPKLGRRTAFEDMRRFRAARRALHAQIAESSASDRWTLLQFKWEEILWGGDVAADRVCLLEHGPIPRDLLRIPWARRRLARAFSTAAVVWSVGEPAERSVTALCGRRPRHLGAGIDPRRIQRARAAAGALRPSLAGASPLLVAYAGRLTRRKGVHDLVDLAEMFPDVAVVLVGEGPERPALEKRAAANERVTVVGHVDDAWPYLAAADCTLLLSTEAGEGRPLVALESLALGTRVVGLSTTPALQALESEFGPGRVVLVQAAEPSLVRRAVSAAGPTITIDPPTWEQVASDAIAQLAEQGVQRVAV